jgi:hypothetical protein
MNKIDDDQLDKIEHIIQSYLIDALNSVFSEIDTYEGYKKKYNGKVFSLYKTNSEEIRVIIENNDHVVILFDQKRFSPEAFKAMENSLKSIGVEIKEKN